MTIYNYEKATDSQNDKYPEYNHSIIETSNGHLYMVLNSDNTKIDKSTDKGATWSNITDESYAIIGLLYDRSNEYIYFFYAWGADSGALKYIDLSDDSVNTVFSGGPLLGLGLGLVFYDLVVESDDDIHIFGTNVQHPADWEWGIVHVDFDYNQVETGLGSDPSSSIALSYAINISDDAYMLAQLTTNHVQLWSLDLALGGSTLVKDIGANLNLSDSKNLRGISYDGTDVLYFILKDTTDSKNYLYTYSITGDTATRIGEYNVSLMLERNTDSSNDPPFNLEKGFDTSSRYIYQIASSKGNLYKIADLTNAVADGTIVAITDIFLFIKRSSNDIEIWEFQDFSNYIIEALIYHSERSYPTAELTYRADKLFLEDGMFLQMIGNVRVNGSTSVGVRFEGYIIAPSDEDDEAIYIKTVDLINPIYYDLKNSYAGTLSAGSGDDWLDTIDDDFDYGTKGTYDAGTLSLPETVRNSGKDNQQFIDQLALGEGFTWRFRPTGELDWTNGADDSGLDYDQSTPIYDVEVTKKKIRPNAITVKGGYVNGSQVSSDTDHGQDLPDQQQYGKIPIEVNIAWISTTSLCNSYADAILALVNREYIEVIFSVRDATNGFVPPGEEITLADSNKGITSAQYKINNVVFDDKTSIATYTVSSVVRWDEDDLLFGFEQELSDQVDQLGTSVATNISDIATNTDDISILDPNILPVFMVGTDGFTSAAYYGACHQVAFSDVNAGVQAGFYVTKGGTFKAKIIHAGDNDNNGLTASGKIRVVYDVDGGSQSWNINGLEWDLALDNTDILLMDTYDTNTITVSDNSHVGVWWYKDDNAGGAAGNMRIYSIILVRQ